MKLVKFIIAAILLCSPVFAQNPSLGALHVAQGNPNTAGVYGNQGDVCSDKSGADTWVKTGGSGTTNWVSLPVLTAVTGQTPVVGSFVLTSTSAVLYLTGSTGLIIHSGTVTPF